MPVTTALLYARLDDARHDGGVDTSLLAALGIDERAEVVYRFVLARPEISLEQVAAGVDLPLETTVRALEELRSTGLVTKSARGEYGVVDPRSAVRHLTETHASHIDRVRASIPALAEIFEDARRADASTSATRIVSGSAAISDWYYRLSFRAATEHMLFDVPPYVLSTTTAIEGASLRRGVRWRAVYAAASLEDDGGVDRLRASVADGEEARVTQHLPVKLAIADRSIALISITLSESEPEAIVTESPALVESLCLLFDLVWQRALPALGADADAEAAEAGIAAEGRTDAAALDRETDSSARRPTPEEAELLALFAVGLKDEAIARQLGVSTRTLRRRIQSLFAELGAANRFHAGVAAARRGWI